ncbi:PAS domain S-box protein [Geomonas sp. RF6]|uniref:hybrid sensor histidine kinase/response regulator n=1 Tax=Geomonas sp. RF6 TaxID=2897342 RepID=UPI001E2EE837|nr:PAS domain S-box protein [Geomonas sp. RF6]UFS71419.1 PAS domain S-box protein [Geomonas sp. RF6]
MSLLNHVVDYTILVLSRTEVGVKICNTLSKHYPQFIIKTAAGCNEALEALKTCNNEALLILHDLTPNGDLCLVERMKNIAPDVPLIVLVDDQDTASMSRCIRFGIRNIVLSPIEDDVLFSAVDTCLQPIAVESRMKDKIESLEANLVLYEALFQNSLDGLLITSEDGFILEANRAACAILGRSLKELQGVAWRNLVDPASCPVAGACQHTGLHQRDHECRAIRNGDRTVFLEVSSAPFTGAASHRHFTVVLRDMTSCRKTQKTLQLREQRLRHALDAAALGCWEYVFGSGEVFLDDRCRAIFGFDPKASVDYTSLLHCLHPADRSAVHGWIKSAMEESVGDYRKEYRIILPDGHIRWIELHGRIYSMDEPSGDGSRFVGVAVDVTDRARAQEALRESEAQYRRLFTAVHEGFSLHEAVVGTAALDYPLIEANPAFETLAGMRREEVVGRSLFDICPEFNDLLLRRLDEVAKSRTPLRLECTAWGRDLSLQLYSPGKGQIAILYSDVTERKKLQEEREKTERLESLGLLAGGIAHDFNNILTAIAGNITLARLKIESGSDPTERLVESESAISKAAALTRQLLTFAQGGEPIKKPLEVAPLIREAVSLFLRGTACNAQLRLGPDLWLLDADGGQIQQALNNLAINAVQAMPEGGTITVSAENVTVEGGRGDLPAGAYVGVSISDAGVGIAPSVLPRIFDPYFTTKSTGSGLGLASVFSIVRKHGGTITVASEQGLGTTFRMILPALTMEREVHTDDPRCTIAARGKEVLVMDDEAPVRDVACALLEELGFSVSPCADGKEAITLYQERFRKGIPFAAVILDMTVPGGLGGKEAASQIRRIDPNAVLIISSGYFSEAFSEWESDVAINGIVAKPYTISQLSEELSQAMTRS